MKTFFRYFSIIILLSLPTVVYAESPIFGHFELKFGNYRPEVDTESSLTSTPYHDIFSNKSNTMTLILVDKTVINWYGSLSIGGCLGYWEVVGNAVSETTKEPVSDKTMLKLIPTGVVATYEFDWPLKKFDIPFSGFIRFGISNVIFKITNSVGDTASYGDLKGEGSQLGYVMGGGIRFLLDFLDNQSAVDFDNSFGVNNTYFFAEFISFKIPGLGDKGLVLSDDVVFFGLSFEF